MPLKVIGAGFGRTGTDSMRMALNLLGFGPTHHMHEVIADPDQQTLWRQLALGAEANWPRLFQGYAACMDWPSAFYWRELIGRYPDARVILTWRTPESWWTSFENTILKALKSANDQESLGHLLVAEGAFGGRPDDRAHAISTYERHVDEVIATVPGDRLLVHRIGDGWEPLCRHLDVAPPEHDYPRLNAAGSFFDKAADGSAGER